MRSERGKQGGMARYIRQTWFRLAIVVAVVAAVGVFIATSGSDMEPVAADAQDVRVLSGGVHTVYHSDVALPTSETPQPEGKPVFVWFSATWCTNCAHMDDFAAGVIESYGDRFAFHEKSVDHDQASVNRYGVRGTPTFLLLDASGKEVARFYTQRDAASFTAAIEEALATAN